MIREWLVHKGLEAEFERVFGSDGSWVKLLKSAEGYLGTRLEKQEYRGFYRVRDSWRSHVDFERFREQRQEALKGFHQMLEAAGLIVSMFEIGAYYGSSIDDEDQGPDESLTPA